MRNVRCYATFSIDEEKLENEKCAMLRDHLCMTKIVR